MELKDLLGVDIRSKKVADFLEARFKKYCSRKNLCRSGFIPDMSGVIHRRLVSLRLADKSLLAKGGPDLRKIAATGEAAVLFKMLQSAYQCP